MSKEPAPRPGGPFPAGAAIVLGITILGFLVILVSVVDLGGTTQRGYPAWIPAAVLAVFAVVLIVRGVLRIRRDRQE